MDPSKQESKIIFEGKGSAIFECMEQAKCMDWSLFLKCTIRVHFQRREEEATTKRFCKSNESNDANEIPKYLF